MSVNSPKILLSVILFSYLCPVIFYFSGTGNSRWAAQRLAEVTGERLVFIPDVIDSDCQFTLSEDERIGWVFPVHGWRPPIVVREFIGKMHISNAEGHFCFALVTAGDDIGQTMEILNADLAHRGLHAESLYSLIMPESYVGLPFMDVDKPEREKAKKQKAAEELERFAREIAQRQRGLTRTYKGHWPRINSHIIGEFFVKKLISDKSFHVTEERCTGCGICIKACPVGNMEGGHGALPQWKHTGRCLTCFACYHHCPQHAIEFGRQTQRKGQYYYEKNKTI